MKINTNYIQDYYKHHILTKVFTVCNYGRQLTRLF